jgi:hypothetical protein
VHIETAVAQRIAPPEGGHHASRVLRGSPSGQVSPAGITAPGSICTSARCTSETVGVSAPHPYVLLQTRPAGVGVSTLLRRGENPLTASTETQRRVRARDRRDHRGPRRRRRSREGHPRSARRRPSLRHCPLTFPRPPRTPTLHPWDLWAGVIPAASAIAPDDRIGHAGDACHRADIMHAHDIRSVHNGDGHGRGRALKPFLDRESP